MMKNVLEYKGTFNVRIQPSLHRRLTMYASKEGEALDSTVEKAIQKYVAETESCTCEKRANYN